MLCCSSSVVIRYWKCTRGLASLHDWRHEVFSHKNIQRASSLRAANPPMTHFSTSSEDTNCCCKVLKQGTKMNLHNTECESNPNQEANHWTEHEPGPLFFNQPKWMPKSTCIDRSGVCRQKYANLALITLQNDCASMNGDQVHICTVSVYTGYVLKCPPCTRLVVTILPSISPPSLLQAQKCGQLSTVLICLAACNGGHWNLLLYSHWLTSYWWNGFKWNSGTMLQFRKFITSTVSGISATFRCSATRPPPETTRSWTALMLLLCRESQVTCDYLRRQPDRDRSLLWATTRPDDLCLD